MRTAFRRGNMRALITVPIETLRLPSMLRHHREFGVHRFFVVDNGSTDGTRELLPHEPDVLFFAADESYAGSHWRVCRTAAEGLRQDLLGNATLTFK